MNIRITVSLCSPQEVVLRHHFGSKGSELGQFNYLRGLAVDRTTGVCYVCDEQNNRIQLFI